MRFNYLKYLARIGRTHIHPHEKEATEVLIRELNLVNGLKVLELGCGTGGTIVRICGRYQLQMVALDMLDEMLNAAQRRVRLAGLADRVLLLKGNLTALPFDGQRFGRIYAESVLGILENQAIRAVLNEVHRVMEDDGIFITNDSIWKKTTTPEQVQEINNACVEDFGLPLASESAWHVDDWLALFQEYGFEARSFLINDVIQSEVETARNKTSRQEAISEAFSRGSRLLGYLKPDIRRERKTYRELLEKHRDDGKFIEARIFILTKKSSQ